MEAQQLEHLIDYTFDRLYGLCFSVSFSSDQSSQLLCDAYTVFVMSEKEFLTSYNLDESSRSDRKLMRKFIFTSMAKIILDLAEKKTRSSVFNRDLELEYKDFFRLNLRQRSLLFLKEKYHLSLDELQDILDLERFQVLELYANAVFCLNEGSAPSIPSELASQLKNRIHCYVNKTLPAHLMKNAEAEIKSSEKAFQYYQEKLREKEFFNSLIPKAILSSGERFNLNEAVKEINLITLPKTRFELLKKTARFLKTPILEI